MHFVEPLNLMEHLKDMVERASESGQSFSGNEENWKGIYNNPDYLLSTSVNSQLEVFIGRWKPSSFNHHYKFIVIWVLRSWNEYWHIKMRLSIDNILNLYTALAEFLPSIIPSVSSPMQHSIACLHSLIAYLHGLIAYLRPSNSTSHSLLESSIPNFKVRFPSNKS